jgi:hypothetical protein
LKDVTVTIVLNVPFSPISLAGRTFTEAKIWLTSGGPETS